MLNHSALSVIEDSDLVLFVIQRTSLQDQDRQVLNKIKETKVPSICVLNKIDQVQNKNDLLPLIQEIDSILFQYYVPISAKNHDGIEDLLGVLKLLFQRILICIQLNPKTKKSLMTSLLVSL